MPQIQSVLKLYKDMGETPLECIKRWKAANPKYKDISMTYAGRLDPMAEGLLLVLTGEECKQKEKHLGLDKEYEVEILLGFATDTFDILGKVCGSLTTAGEFRLSDYRSTLQSFVGKFAQKYPKYSSKMLAKSKGSSTKEVEIYSIKSLDQRMIGCKKLLQTIEKRISKVKGDFRQKPILSLWRKNLQNKQSKYQIAKIKVKCSSGTYMRSLAHNLGRKLGIPALAYSIKRTKISLFSNV